MPIQNIGPTTVPDVRNLSNADALLALGALYLSADYGISVYSSLLDVDLVISQSPAPGTQVDSGSSVTLILSLGINPGMVEIVPYLIGDTEDLARRRIEALYCTPDVEGSGGSVAAQDPAFLTEVSRGSTIQVTMGGPLNNAAGRGRTGLPPYRAPDSRQ